MLHINYEFPAQLDLEGLQEVMRKIEEMKEGKFNFERKEKSYFGEPLKKKVEKKVDQKVVEPAKK